MVQGLTRRRFAQMAALGAAGYRTLASAQSAAGGAVKTLRFIAQSDLRVLDPVWTAPANGCGLRRIRRRAEL